MKTERQKKILELIRIYSIETQEELIARLETEGYHVKQATVSRDIRDLGLIKGATDGGGYKYILPAKSESAVPRFTSSLTASVVSIVAAENLLVIKTFPGMANAVAACVDSLHISEVIGCVAGDDTILAVIQDAESAERLRGKLRIMLENF